MTMLLKLLKFSRTFPKQNKIPQLSRSKKKILMGFLLISPQTTVCCIIEIRHTPIIE